jgi:hypothetical protein
MLRELVKKVLFRVPGYSELVEIHGALRELRRDIAELRTIEILRILDFELANHPRYSDSKRLLTYAKQVNSQNGEDGIIHEIFRRIGRTSDTFVEIGVGDGTENNTAFLLAQGWTGFCIDASDSFVANVDSRPDLNNGCLKWKVCSITKENIGDILENLGVPKEFDLLSVDIDQNTYYAWEGMSGFHPRVVVIEYNAALPPDVIWKVNYDPARIWNFTQNHGASLKALEQLGRAFGYSLVGCDFTGTNAFFVRNDCVSDRFCDPFTAENHYEPPRSALSDRRIRNKVLLDRALPNQD